MNDPIDSTDRLPVQPGLYLVSTPVGNLRDITLRALDVLEAADAVLCEDTRVTAKLLSAYNLRKKMIVYNDHADDTDRAGVLARLAAGEALALVTDAGTPLVSDPGYKLVAAARAAGFAVTPVPGASALLPAIQMAGLPSDRFMFAGFLPHKSAARRAVFSELRDVPATLVFYESPLRLHDAVTDALAVLGDRPVAIAREITKLHEEARHGTLAAWAADETLLGTMKGELVLLLGAPVGAALTDADISERLARAMEGMSLKDAVAAVCGATGAPKKAVYDLALRLRDGNA